MTEVYDNSMLTCFSQDCEMYYNFRYVHGLTSVKPEAALQFGQGFHAVCDALFAGISLEQALVDFRAVVPQDLDEKRTVAIGELIAREYYARYFNVSLFDDIINIESWHQIDIDDFSVGGRIDKIVKWLYGLTPVDHKTTSTQLNKYVKTLDLKHQFTGYITILQQYYEGISDNLLVDIAFVPRPLKTKAPETAFDRVLTERTKFQKEFWRKWVQQTVSDIRRARETGHYRQFDNHCDSWNRECQYKQLCELLRTQSIIDVLDFAKSSIDYKIEDWRPHGKVL